MLFFTHVLVYIGQYNFEKPQLINYLLCMLIFVTRLRYKIVGEKSKYY